MTDPVPLAGGSNGEGADPSDYADALASWTPRPINIVVLAGQRFSDAQATLLAHVETAENNGRERIAVVGTDGDAVALASSNADSVGDDRLILVAPGIQAEDLTSGTTASLPAAYSAAAVAGLLASLAVQVSPTNKTLAVSGLGTLYNDGQLKQLLGSRILPLQRKAGFRVVKGITTDSGPFRQISVRRIVDYAKQGTRIGSLPYIGRLNNARVRGALQATLNGFLADMVLNEQLTEFTLDRDRYPRAGDRRRRSGHDAAQADVQHRLHQGDHEPLLGGGDGQHQRVSRIGRFDRPCSGHRRRGRPGPGCDRWILADAGRSGDRRRGAGRLRHPAVPRARAALSDRAAGRAT